MYFIKNEIFCQRGEEKIEKKKTACLSVNSVAKDLRVTILDKYGKKISGIPFVVNVEGIGEYKDLDTDGYVYIAGLKEGNYDVSVLENDEYVCKDIKNIDVFETVQYVPLSDIKLSIVSEKDINVEESFKSLDKIIVEMDKLVL